MKKIVSHKLLADTRYGYLSVFVRTADVMTIVSNINENDAVTTAFYRS